MGFFGGGGGSKELAFFEDVFSNKWQESDPILGAWRTQLVESPTEKLGTVMIRYCLLDENWFCEG